MLNVAKKFMNGYGSKLGQDMDRRSFSPCDQNETECGPQKIYVVHVSGNPFWGCPILDNHTQKELPAKKDMGGIDPCLGEKLFDLS